MINLGLTKAEVTKLLKLLVSSHTRVTQIQLMDLNHNYLGEISDKFISGQVNLDNKSDKTTRSVTLELIDPSYDLNLDTDAPTDGSMYLTRMVKVVTWIISPDGVDRYPIPLFCGPLSKVSRVNAIVSLEAQGKEILALAPVWKAKTFRKGTKITEVIKTVLQLAGETKFDIPNLTKRLPRDFNMSRKTSFWAAAKKLARMLDMQLFYDGRGVARLRKIPSKSEYTFRDSESILGAPQVSYDSEGIVNAIEIEGGKPKGAKKKVSYRLVAPANHVLSPRQLGRNNVPRYLPEVIEDDSIKSIKEARRIAKRELSRRLVQSVEVAFDSVPLFIFEEGDLVRYEFENSGGGFRIQQIAYPLVADGVSSVGYLKKVTPKKRPGKVGRQAW